MSTGMCHCAELSIKPGLVLLHQVGFALGVQWLGLADAGLGMPGAETQGVRGRIS